jgi:glutamyl-tRNA synthetase
MNIDSLRLAILNHIISKRLDEDLIIRIDDLDKNLNIEGLDEEIIKIINLFSIDYKYIINQSDNIKFHNQMAKQLNKEPSYDLCSAVDDMLSNISTIIIDKQDKNNTIVQDEIRNSLGYTKDINYIYLAPITNIKDISVISLIAQGYLPAAIANYLVEISYNIPKEIFTLEDAIQNFDINRISNTPTPFNLERLKIINKKYLTLIDNMRLSKLIGYADEDIGKLAKLYLNQCDTIKQIKEKIDLIFNPNLKKSPQNLQNEFIKIKESISQAPFINDFEEFKQHISKQTNFNDKLLITLLNIAFTGSNDNPNLDIIYPLIKNYIGVII